MDEQFYDSNNSYENSSQEIPVYTPPTPKKREKKPPREAVSSS